MDLREQGGGEAKLGKEWVRHVFGCFWLGFMTYGLC